jgi:hypothetical protein
MEGKALAAAYCALEAQSSPDADVIVIDFKTGQPKAPTQTVPSGDQSLLTALDPFVVGDRGVEWHDAGSGHTVVKDILARMRKGEKVGSAPDFGYKSDEELIAGLTNDLKILEQILSVAQKANTEFCLAFDF